MHEFQENANVLLHLFSYLNYKQLNCVVSRFLINIVHLLFSIVSCDLLIKSTHMQTMTAGDLQEIIIWPIYFDRKLLALAK